MQIHSLQSSWPDLPELLSTDILTSGHLILSRYSCRWQTPESFKYSRISINYQWISWLSWWRKCNMLPGCPLCNMWTGCTLLCNVCFTGHVIQKLIKAIEFQITETIMRREVVAAEFQQILGHSVQNWLTSIVSEASPPVSANIAT